MRKNSTRLVLLLVTCVVMAGCAKREIKNLGSQGKNIICFGDSLTFGYGVEKGEDYPSLLAKMTSMPVINAGVSGDTSPNALKRIEKDVLAKDPYLVIVEFGGNDFLYQIPKETTCRNIRAIIDMIQARGAMVVVADISAGFLFQEYKGALRQIAYEKDAAFIPDVFFGIITNPSMKSDFIHPNSLGYGLVARRIFHGIQPYVGEYRAQRGVN